MGDTEHRPVYALNLFDVTDRHGGKVIAFGQFSEAIVGEIEPRQVLILVGFESCPRYRRKPNP